MAKTDAQRAKQREYSQRFYAKHRERVIDWVRRYQEERNPEAYQQHQQAGNQRRVRKHRDAQERKAGRPRPLFCEACGRPPAPGKLLHYDHCHEGGHFRGWLCHGCNVALGMVQDDIERLLRLAAYLEFDLLKRE